LPPSRTVTCALAIPRIAERIKAREAERAMVYATRPRLKDSFSKTIEKKIRPRNSARDGPASRDPARVSDPP
jgi:hypothetical protein